MLLQIITQDFAEIAITLIQLEEAHLQEEVRLRLEEILLTVIAEEVRLQEEAITTGLEITHLLEVHLPEVLLEQEVLGVLAEHQVEVLGEALAEVLHLEEEINTAVNLKI